MNTRLIILDLVLRELGMEPAIDSLQDRIRLQKAIYLSQEAGVPLGYRFGWYVRGPYSKGLARDYYYLQMASSDGLEAHSKKLRQDVKSALAKVRPILAAPSDVEFKHTSDWLELVSSIHYLQKTVGRDNHQVARDRLSKIKPRLSSYIGLAEQALGQVDLVPIKSG